jgi:beta-mannosidase
VRLERWQAVRIGELRATVAQLSAARCELRVELGLERAAETAGLVAQLTLLDPDGGIAANRTVALERAASLSLAVEQPRLWWTADLGAQPLYRLVVTLLQGEAIVDRRSLSLGLRTIALDQSPDPDEPGASFFRFVLNGVPIVARGACWIPASSFVGTVDAARYRMLLEQAVGANMNMLRVWGGGVYEHDAFYELCDELGLLVWQDLMFACAPYPEDDAQLVENIREEVRYQARRLRHHAALALWCGNNECQVLHIFAERIFGPAGPLPGTLYYERLIPEVLAELDPATPYWPGSPWGGPSPNSMRAGDVHDWTVWHGVPPCPDDQFVGAQDRSPAGVHYRRYAEDQGRFISEFGIQAAPSLDALRRWMDAADLELGSAGLLERIKDHPKDKVHAMLEPVTGLPRTLEEYVDFTMLLQAEGLKFGIEHFRRRKPHCSGMLVWQYNDCWPCVSWSLADYDGGGKASLYAVARAYAPVLASFKPLDEGAVELWITNDTLRPLEGAATVELLRLGGGAQWSEALRYAVPANSSRPVWRGRAPALAADRVLQVRAADRAFADNRLLLAPVKDLQLARGARPQCEIATLGPGELELRLRAEAWLLGVAIEAPQAGTRFSDNYFDLRPGESRVVRVCNTQRPLAAGELRVRCWNERG